jgi:hypothetical protein
MSASTARQGPQALYDLGLSRLAHFRTLPCACRTPHRAASPGQKAQEASGSDSPASPVVLASWRLRRLVFLPTPQTRLYERRGLSCEMACSNRRWRMTFATHPRRSPKAASVASSPAKQRWTRVFHDPILPKSSRVPCPSQLIAERHGRPVPVIHWQKVTRGASLGVWKGASVSWKTVVFP